MRNRKLEACKRLGCFAIALLICSGCQKPAPTPVVAPVTPATSAAKPASAVQPADIAVAETPKPAKTPDSTAKQIDPPKDAAKTADVPAGKTEPAAVKADEGHRLLVFSPAGPVVMQLKITIQGQPFSQIHELLIDEMLLQSDSNRDGRTTWEEATASPWFAMNAGSGRMEDAKEKDRQIKIYDRNRDGQVDRIEAIRYASRGDGIGGQFLLDGESEDGYAPSRSVIWQLLDADADGVLSADETAAAAERLKARDADDNDLLEVTEFDVSKATSADPQANTSPAPDAPISAPRVAQLGSRARWDSISYAMMEQYEHDRQLDVDHFPLLRRVVESLDADGNHRLDRTEIKGLNDIAPHLSFEIHFGANRVAPSSPPHPLTPSPPHLLSVSPDLGLAKEIVKQQPGNELLLALPELSVRLVLNDSQGDMDYEQIVATQVAAVDTDKNGYLEKAEIEKADPNQAANFAAMDTDNDGKLYPKELVAYARRQQLFAMSQVRAKTNDRFDAAFTSLDTDSDGRLSLREIRTAQGRLTGFDVNRDGQVTLDEVPRTLAITFERGAGRAMGNSPTAAMSRPMPVRPSTGPPWFARMDSNRDGDVSPREFLGTPEQFTQLDGDRDGFLSSSEAAAAQAANEATKSAAEE